MSTVGVRLVFLIVTAAIGFAVGWALGGQFGVWGVPLGIVSGVLMGSGCAYLTTRGAS